MAITYPQRVRNVATDVPTAGNPVFSVEVLTEIADDGVVIGEKGKRTVTLTLADFSEEQTEAYEAFKAALLGAAAAKLGA